MSGTRARTPTFAAVATSTDDAVGVEGTFVAINDGVVAAFTSICGLIPTLTVEARSAIGAATFASTRPLAEFGATEADTSTGGVRTVVSTTAACALFLDLKPTLTSEAISDLKPTLTAEFRSAGAAEGDVETFASTRPLATFVLVSTAAALTLL